MMEILAISGCPSLELGMAFQRDAADSPSPLRRFPLQLDLLPMHPESQHSAMKSASAQAPMAPLRTQVSHHSVLVASNVNFKDPNGATTVLEIHSRGIDMNKLPSSDFDDADVSSSPNSILSPFHTKAGAMPANLIIYPKRERESFTEFDQERDQRDRGGGEATSAGSDEEDGGMPRKKLRLSREQSALLEESFKEHSTLNPKQKSALAKELNLRPRQVEVWFQNRRARTKLKQTEIDCELLKRLCESLTEENRRLQKELHELRAIKLLPPYILAPDLFMPFPAATLSMCPSCEKVTPPAETARSISLPQLSKSAAAAASTLC